MKSINIGKYVSGLMDHACFPFVERLWKSLLPDYTPPATAAGYDHLHVLEMLRWGDAIFQLHPDQNGQYTNFVVAVILHNTDRPNELKKQIVVGEGFGWKNTHWCPYLERLLEDAPQGIDRDLVIRAVLEHSKRNDEEGDSFVLTALRTADKFVRFGAYGMQGQCANRGRTGPFHNPANPFQFADDSSVTAGEDPVLSIFEDYLRVLQWTGMIHSSMWAIMPWDLIAEQVLFVRLIGRRMSQIHNIQDRTEDCLRTALGVHYFRFPKIA